MHFHGAWMAESAQQRTLAIKIQELRDGEPQSAPFEHALHCLDALRQEVLCNADDTPRWSGYEDRTSGVGQYRLCKDWGRLEAFAKENHACHRHIDLEDGQDILERYKFCPEGSPYEAKVKEAYGEVEMW